MMTYEQKGVITLGLTVHLPPSYIFVITVDALGHRIEITSISLHSDRSTFSYVI